jgi:hypothetical protein
MRARSTRTQAVDGRAIPAARTAARRPGGALALADITSMTETGEGPGGAPTVRLTLRITAPGVTLDTAAGVVVTPERRANFEAGQLIVLVDPKTGDFQIDWERSAIVNGLVPALLTVTGDDATYDLTGQSAPLVEILRLLRAHDLPLHHQVDAGASPALREQLHTILRAAAAQTQ